MKSTLLLNLFLLDSRVWEHSHSSRRLTFDNGRLPRTESSHWPRGPRSQQWTVMQGEHGFPAVKTFVGPTREVGRRTKVVLPLLE
jgi:hypothetical protein